MIQCLPLMVTEGDPSLKLGCQKVAEGQTPAGTSTLCIRFMNTYIMPYLVTSYHTVQ